MAVENWPKIAERIARKYGGEPFTGEKPNDKWCYRLEAGGVRLKASGVATVDGMLEVGDFAFPANPGLAFSEAVMRAIADEDGPTAVNTWPLGKPPA